MNLEFDARLFWPQDDPEEQRALFSSMVSLVEVEVHSLCNRQCWFCPNSVIDRHTEAKYLPEPVYLRLLKDLASIDWRGKLSFGRYNEPFAHPVFWTRLAQAREILPQVKRHTNTNGDFVTRDTIEKARKAGLTGLHVQVYLAKDEEFNGDLVRLKVLDRAAQLGVAVEITRQNPTHIVARGRVPGMDFRIVARDFRTAGTNRCDLGVSGEYTRTTPCVEPDFHVYVDHTGDVMPCCNLRSDYPPHRFAILGTLTEEEGSVFAIFGGKPATAWRRRTALAHTLPRTCLGCRFSAGADIPNLQRILNKHREP